MNKFRWFMLNLFFQLHIKYQYIHNYIITLYKKKNKTKVFCVGDIKTGTQSLHLALLKLGYRSARLPYIYVFMKKGEEEFVNKLKKSNFDAFIDYPMGVGEIYKKIDKAFPNAKFIITLRETEKFRKSYSNYFRNAPFIINKEIEIDERVDRFDKHNQEVINYFKDRPGKLLIVDITKGDGWDKLCKFLNKPIPDIPFPHRNKGKYKKSKNPKPTSN